MESPRGMHFFAFNEAVFSSSKRLAARNPVGVLAHSAGLCPLCVWGPRLKGVQRTHKWRTGIGHRAYICNVGVLFINPPPPADFFFFAVFFLGGNSDLRNDSLLFSYRWLYLWLIRCFRILLRSASTSSTRSTTLLVLRILLALALVVLVVLVVLY